MALITRVSRLMRADLHAVLDRVEEPDVLLRQAVREMEESLDSERRDAKHARQEQRRITSRRGEAASTLERIGRELDLCFESGREDLARSLVRRKLVAERAARALDEREEALARSLDELDARIADHQCRLEEMREKADLFAATESQSDEPDWGDAATDAGVREADVEIALLREKQARQTRATEKQAGESGRRDRS